MNMQRLNRLLIPTTLALYDAGAVKIDTKVGFKLKAHEKNPELPLSPIYFNIRMPGTKDGTLTQEVVDLIGQLLWETAKFSELRFDAVCGLPNAGTPIAEAFIKAAAAEGQLFHHVLLEKTETESGRVVDRIKDTAGVSAGSTVLVIDDLVSRGDTKIEGAGVLITKGSYVVRDVLVLLDRLQGGAADLAKHGLRLTSAMTIEGALSRLVTARRITATIERTVLEYLQL